jgi:deoxyribonuclease-4
VGSAYVLDDVNQLSQLVQREVCLQFSLHPTMITHPIAATTLRDPVHHQGYLIYHSKYIFNFCHPEVSNQTDALVQDLKLASQLKCDVIIHQGKNVTEEKMTKMEAINNYVCNISEVLEQTASRCYTPGAEPSTETMIWLENSAGQGTELGYTLAELAFIYHQFEDTARERLGFCLDTCHAFAAGQLDLRRLDSTVQFFGEFDQQIGLDHLRCLHLNDSGVSFGARRDLHGDLMGGYITNPLLGGSLEGMQWLVEWATHQRVPMIFETPCLLPGQGERQLEIVRQWSRGQVINLVDYKEVQQKSYEYYQLKNRRHKLKI